MFKLAHAYPVYTLGFERSMNIVNEYIKSFDNFASIGRQGAFRYINSHLAMRQAYDTADYIKKKIEN